MVSQQGFGVFAGSFDPVTRGHTDIIRRALVFLPAVEVAVGRNLRKGGGLLGMDGRLALLREGCKEFGDRVRITAFDGLLVDHMIHSGSNILIRGVRDESDFGYEVQLADALTQVATVRGLTFETIYLRPTGEVASFSSSMVRELVAYQAWDVVETLLPKGTTPLLREMLRPSSGGMGFKL
jgi:pantetheine-phosphate adenylyltransferase